MIPLAIWLVLIGYSVTWTGRQNLGLSYRPQADGTLQVVDGTGRPAQTWTLTDALTCGPASGQQAPVQGPQTPGTGTSRTLSPPGIPIPNPIPILGGALRQLPRVQLPPVQLPQPRVPTPPLGPIGDLVDGLARDVHSVLVPIVDGFRSELGRVHLPGLTVPRPGAVA